MVIPYDERARRAPAGGGLHRARAVGLRGHTDPSSIRCCCTSPTSTSTASRSSSRPTSCWPCTCAATPSPREQKARNFAYYEALTVRDSSLSACTQAVMAAEVGHLDLAYDYLGEAALMDLGDLEHNTRDGLHIASLAGAWIALVAGLGRHARTRRRLGFAPRLPDGHHPAGLHHQGAEQPAERRDHARCGYLSAAGGPAGADRPLRRGFPLLRSSPGEPVARGPCRSRTRPSSRRVGRPGDVRRAPSQRGCGHRRERSHR